MFFGDNDGIKLFRLALLLFKIIIIICQYK